MPKKSKSKAAPKSKTKSKSKSKKVTTKSVPSVQVTLKKISTKSVKPVLFGVLLFLGAVAVVVAALLGVFDTMFDDIIHIFKSNNGNKRPHPPPSNKSIVKKYNCNLENGLCTNGKYSMKNGKIIPGSSNCVGSDQKCGINMVEGKTCNDMLNKYGNTFFTCDQGYDPSVNKVGGDDEGYCQFTCKLSDQNDQIPDIPNIPNVP
jgi:hypothetical protein